MQGRVGAVRTGSAGEGQGQPQCRALALDLDLHPAQSPFSIFLCGLHGEACGEQFLAHPMRRIRKADPRSGGSRKREE